jgi:hypothetical protein
VRHRLTWIAVVAAVAASAIALVARGGEGASSACTPRWRIIAHPSRPTFASIVPFSPTDVWAVGVRGKQNHELPVIVHWDGRRLHTLTGWLPSVRPAWLAAVAGVASDDLWAVGGTGEYPHESPLIVHWDGSRWSEVPLPGGLRGNALNDAVAIASDDVWAVGGSEFHRRPLVMHWDGLRWRVQAIGAALPKPEDVGGQELGPTLHAVDGASADDVWTIGTYDAPDFAGYLPVEAYWNGGEWAPPKATFRGPNRASYGGPYGAEGVDVDARATGDAWTLEISVDILYPWQYRILHWHGRASRAYGHYTVGASPAAIAAASSTSLWIVGTRWDSEGNRELGPLVIHWLRGKVRIEHTPFERLRSASLVDIQMLSSTDIWAVGARLIARYSC